MNKRKIFVGNLSYTVTENQLAGFLSKHGEVLSVKVMEGKGYAFVEMKTPEQAQAIKNSLSEEMFEGRRLLLDDVPSKGHNRRKTSDSSFEGQSPRNTSGAGKDTRNPLYRSGAPVRRVRTEENAHQLTDVTDEFKKKYNKEQKPVNQDKQQKSHPASPKSSVRSSPPPAAVRGEGKSVPKQQERDKPITQVERAEQSPRKYTKTAQTGRGPEKRTDTQKPKKVKEQPPKNPQPYQGSKKTRRAPQHSDETHGSSDESQENEKRNYLRYWATISGKRRE